ncbi:dCTP deaminase domain-containing protein [Tumebacillus flagellatus]|uniref:Deoxycytidine triphosphate deaminase n=1 Tax=Tumebacillus flagellatus TaxID=1157490 RepID=A0A074LXN5_9BACL|nr:hypothetical protein [Tumebacillus flagellatus]KEO84883.1 hypothetical protein EL26_02410 [Tumebacillus flagellatus]
MQAEEAQPVIGLLTENEIREGLTSGEVVIWPFEEGKITPAGYDLTPTEWVFSLNSRLLVPVVHEGAEKFCWVEPQDTVLVLTREAVRLPRYIAGTLLSKASVTAGGFGHFSMALDAQWQGPLLLAMNNPTGRRVKLPFVTVGEDGEVREHTVAALRFDLIRSFMGMKSEIREARLSFPQEAQSGKKDPLAECLRGIAEIDFLAGQGERFEAEVFKRNYEEALKRIRFYTERGQRISREVLTRRRLVAGVRQGGFGAALVGVLSYMGYQAVAFGDWTFLAFGGMLLGVLFLKK